MKALAKYRALLLCGLALGLLLLGYFYGLKLLLLGASVVAGALFLPMPSVFKSWMARGVVSVFFSLAILQLAAIVQFFMWPQSDFRVVAVLYVVFWAILLGGVLHARGQLERRTRPIFSRADFGGLLVTLIFLLPLLPIAVQRDNLPRLVEIGGLQSPDAQHHQEFIQRMDALQHLDTTGYPKTFHFAVAFWQNAFGIRQTEAAWQTNVQLSFVYYLMFGALLAYVSFYLCYYWLRKMTNSREVPWLLVLTMAIALAAPLALLALWPFVTLGFLNYYYVLATLMLGIIFVQSCSKDHLQQSRAFLLLALLLFLGVSVGWLLLAPIGIFIILAAAGWLGQLPKRFTKVQPWHALLTVGLLLQCTGLYLQLAHPGTSGLNDLGALRVLPVLPIILGVGLCVVVVQKRFQPYFRNQLSVLFASVYAMVGTLVLVQLLTVGEVRYFAIKVSILLLIFLLVLATAFLLYYVQQKARRHPQVLVLAVLTPLLATVLLMASAPAAFKEVRELFREPLGLAKPDFYDQDAQQLTRLGRSEKINHYNATVLHYDAQKKTVVGHTLLAAWAQNIKYDRFADAQARSCAQSIYLLTTQESSAKTVQNELSGKVKECVRIAQKKNRNYYIITDKDSQPHLQKMFRGATFLSF